MYALNLQAFSWNNLFCWLSLLVGHVCSYTFCFEISYWKMLLKESHFKFNDLLRSIFQTVNKTMFKRLSYVTNWGGGDECGIVKRYGALHGEGGSKITTKVT